MTIIFDEPAETYHENDAIGSSEVRAYLRSPRLFRDMRDKVEKKETAALLFGTAMHTLFLEPERYARTIIAKPDGMSFATKDGKAWRDEQVAAGLTIISFQESIDLARMRQRMPKEVAALVIGSPTEVTIRTQLDGLATQCRFDVYGKPRVDLKSIEEIEGLDKSIYKYGYHIQQRWYQRVEEAQTGTKAEPFLFVFAEKKPPYRWRIVELDADYIALADQEIDSALHGIKARMASGCWDDPDPIRELVSPPQWLADQLTYDTEE